MTRKGNSAEKRAARELQARTGMPYTAALRQVRRDRQAGRCGIVTQGDDGLPYVCVGEAEHRSGHGPWELIDSPPIVGRVIDLEGGSDATQEETQGG